MLFSQETTATKKMAEGDMYTHLITPDTWSFVRVMLISALLDLNILTDYSLLLAEIKKGTLNITISEFKSNSRVGNALHACTHICTARKVFQGDAPPSGFSFLTVNTSSYNCTHNVKTSCLYFLLVSFSYCKS